MTIDRLVEQVSLKVQVKLTARHWAQYHRMIVDGCPFESAEEVLQEQRRLDAEHLRNWAITYRAQLVEAHGADADLPYDEGSIEVHDGGDQ